MTKVLTTTISDEQWNICKEKGWKWSEIMRAGIGQLMKPDSEVERMMGLENEIYALRKQIDRFTNSSKKKEPSRIARLMGWDNE